MKKILKCVSINKMVNGQGQVVLHELADESTPEKPVVLSVITKTFKDAKECDAYKHLSLYTEESTFYQ